MISEMLQVFFVRTQRVEMTEINFTGSGEGNMLTDPLGIGDLYHAGEGFKGLLIEWPWGSKREPEAMDVERICFPEPPEQLLPAVEEMLGGDL